MSVGSKRCTSWGSVSDLHHPARRLVFEADTPGELRVRIANEGKRGTVCTLDGESVAFALHLLSFANIAHILKVSWVEDDEAAAR